MSHVDVRVLSEAFCSLDEWDATVQRLKVIIVLPQCSSSALNDPVPTIHCEHGGMLHGRKGSRLESRQNCLFVSLYYPVCLLFSFLERGVNFALTNQKRSSQFYFQSTWKLWLCLPGMINVFFMTIKEIVHQSHPHFGFFFFFLWQFFCHHYSGSGTEL